jgi:hypothetical protein
MLRDDPLSDNEKLPATNHTDEIITEQPPNTTMLMTPPRETIAEGVTTRQLPPLVRQQLLLTVVATIGTSNQIFANRD